RRLRSRARISGTGAFQERGEIAVSLVRERTVARFRGEAVSLLASQTALATITTTSRSTARAFESSPRGFSVLLLLSTLVIYLLLGHPLRELRAPLRSSPGSPRRGSARS